MITEINIKISSIDPLGEEINTNEMSLSIPNEDSNVQSRLVINIGECLYVINKKGLIIERLIPSKV